MTSYQEATQVTEDVHNHFFQINDLIVERYMVLKQLGMGNMGVVYLCVDTLAGIKVAVKALPPHISNDMSEMEKIRANFKLVGGLHHQNVAALKQIECDAYGNFYIVMEYVDGVELPEYCANAKKRGAYNLEFVIRIIAQIATALDYTHSCKIVHRDIKPSNVMVTKDHVVKILDYGIAIPLVSNKIHLESTFELVGTPKYMPPEQWKGEHQTGATDQYALAAMTYELISGKVPFKHADYTQIQQMALHDIPPKISGLCSKAFAVICKGLSKHPTQRYGSCTEFVEALTTAIREKSCLKKSKTYIVISLLIMGLIAGIIFGFSFNEQQIQLLEPIERIALGAPPEILELHKKIESEYIEYCKMRKNRKMEGEADFLVILKDGKSLLQNKKYSECYLAFIKANAALALLVEKIKQTEDSGRFVPPEPSFERGFAMTRNKPAIEKESITLQINDHVSMNFMFVEGGKYEVIDYPLEPYPLSSCSFVFTTDDFWLGQTEVTREQWNALLGEASINDGFFPKVNITDQETIYFIEKLNKFVQDKNILPKGYEFSLPYNVEWEYAARGGQKTKHYHFSGSDDPAQIMPLKQGNRHSGMSYSGSRLPNELGLYDMCGNVEELCRNILKDQVVSCGGADGGMIQRCYSTSGNYTRDVEKATDTKGFRVAITPIAKKNSFEKTSKKSWEGQARDYLLGESPQVERRADPALRPLQPAVPPPNSDLEKKGEPVVPNFDRGFAMSRTKPAVEKEPITVQLHEGVKMNFMFVEGGKYEVIDYPFEPYPISSCSFIFTTGDFWLGQTEVTQEQWHALLGGTPNQELKLPKTDISFDDVKNFIQKLNDIASRNDLLPTGYEFAIPYNIEWEYAARGGQKSKHYHFSGSDAPAQVMFLTGGQFSKKGRVGACIPNELGLYDMCGNVEEICKNIMKEGQPIACGGRNGNMIQRCFPTSSNGVMSEMLSAGSDKGVRVAIVPTNIKHRFEKTSHRSWEGEPRDFFLQRRPPIERLADPALRPLFVASSTSRSSKDKDGFFNGFKFTRVKPLVEKEPVVLDLYKKIKLKLMFVEGGKYEVIENPFDIIINYFNPYVFTTGDFWLGQTEVTEEQWHAVMGGKALKPDRPKVDIAVSDIMSFIEKINKLEGIKDKIPEGYELGFPLEMEWEYAARGGQKSEYYVFSGSDDPNDIMFLNPDDHAGLGEVGKKMPNELGLYDMCGNVEEVCKKVNKLTSSQNFICCGGRKDNKLMRCYPTSRNKNYFDVLYPTAVKGFRLALNPIEKENVQFNFNESFSKPKEELFASIPTIKKRAPKDRLPLDMVKKTSGKKLNLKTPPKLNPKAYNFSNIPIARTKNFTCDGTIFKVVQGSMGIEVDVNADNRRVLHLYAGECTLVVQLKRPLKEPMLLSFNVRRFNEVGKYSFVVSASKDSKAQWWGEFSELKTFSTLLTQHYIQTGAMTLPAGTTLIKIQTNSESKYKHLSYGGFLIDEIILEPQK